ncbi:hypothetical protein G7Y89_g11322 [Cudoniella acicularis]|uniref:Peptidase A1 domain-containing protein n=1 Tax=Cudoniella acicularis TaxID=354080 RepID=A0A8H4RCK1_9HELO|nr:hypothetical protein G7Y89_g11322 [Cudoniella acicularis]
MKPTSLILLFVTFTVTFADTNNSASPENGFGPGPANDATTFEEANKFPNATGAVNIQAVNMSMDGNHAQPVPWAVHLDITEVSNLNYTSSPTDVITNSVLSIATLGNWLPYSVWDTKIIIFTDVALNATVYGQKDKGDCYAAFGQQCVQDYTGYLLQSNVTQTPEPPASCNNRLSSASFVNHLNSTFVDKGAYYYASSAAHLANNTMYYEQAVTRIWPILLIQTGKYGPSNATGIIQASMSCLRANATTEGSLGIGNVPGAATSVKVHSAIVMRRRLPRGQIQENQTNSRNRRSSLIPSLQQGSRSTNLQTPLQEARAAEENTIPQAAMSHIGQTCKLTCGPLSSPLFSNFQSPVTFIYLINPHRKGRENQIQSSHYRLPPHPPKMCIRISEDHYIDCNHTTIRSRKRCPSSLGFFKNDCPRPYNETLTTTNRFLGLCPNCGASKASQATSSSKIETEVEFVPRSPAALSPKCRWKKRADGDLEDARQTKANAEVYYEAAQEHLEGRKAELFGELRNDEMSGGNRDGSRRIKSGGGGGSTKRLAAGRNRKLIGGELENEDFAGGNKADAQGGKGFDKRSSGRTATNRKEEAPWRKAVGSRQTQTEITRAEQFCEAMLAAISLPVKASARTASPHPPLPPPPPQNPKPIPRENQISTPHRATATSLPKNPATYSHSQNYSEPEFRTQTSPI